MFISGREKVGVRMGLHFIDDNGVAIALRELLSSRSRGWFQM